MAIVSMRSDLSPRGFLPARLREARDSIQQIEWATVQRVRARNAVSLQRLKATIGFAASLLAIWCQILFLATISLSPLASGASPIGDVPICHADDGTQPAQQKPNHPAHDCILCVLCLSHASPLAILAPTPQLPRHQTVAAVQLGAVYARGPPISLVAAAQPRGPPSLT
jgi:hypothetical protein